MKIDHSLSAAALSLGVSLLFGIAGQCSAQSLVPPTQGYGLQSPRPSGSTINRPDLRYAPGFGGTSQSYTARGSYNGLPSYQAGSSYSYGHILTQPRQSTQGDSMRGSSGTGSAWPCYGAGQTCVNNYSATPPLLGGYYFPDYVDQYDGSATLPSVYCLYPGFPGYVYYNVDGFVTIQPAPAFTYSGDAVPFDGISQPTYQVNNQYNNYTVNNYNTSPAQDTDAGSTLGAAEAPAAVSPGQSDAAGYVDAFLDIQSAWQSGNVALLQKHLRTGGVQVAVSVNSAYVYSIAAEQFAKTTQDAFDKLQTASFQFTTLRKETNGDVTGFATHTYAASGSDNGQSTMYLSFTLSKRAGQWIVVAINSSATPMTTSEGQSTSPGPNSAGSSVAMATTSY